MRFHLVLTMYSGCKYCIGVHSLVCRDGVTNGASAKAENENGVAIINVWVQKFRYGCVLGNERMSFATGRVNAKSPRFHRSVTSSSDLRYVTMTYVNPRRNSSRFTAWIWFSWESTGTRGAHARRSRERVRVGINRRINYPIRHEPFITQ